MFDPAIETISPDMCACSGINKLTGDANAVSRLAHTAFENKAHSEFATDLPHIDATPSVLEARIARDYGQPLDAGQSGDDFLDDPIREMLLVRIVAHVVKREDSYGRMGRGLWDRLNRSPIDRSW